MNEQDWIRECFSTVCTACYNESVNFSEKADFVIAANQLQRCLNLLSSIDNYPEHAGDKVHLRKAMFNWRQRLFHHNGVNYSNKQNVYYYLESGEEIHNFEHTKDVLIQMDVNDYS